MRKLPKKKSNVFDRSVIELLAAPSYEPNVEDDTQSSDESDSNDSD